MVDISIATLCVGPQKLLTLSPKKAECEGVSESVNTLPSFRQAFSIGEGACLGKCISDYLYSKLLVLTDETRGDSISEVNVFGVGTPVQNVCSTACIKQVPFLRVVSSKNEVPSRNDLDISCTFGELLTGDQQLPKGARDIKIISG